MLVGPSCKPERVGNLRSKSLTLPDLDANAEAAPVPYVGPTARQMAVRAAVLPPEIALRKAEQTLATSPVPGYPGFIPEEVRALAAYRCQFLSGREDAVWQAIVDAASEAWLYAVHEAAEIEALVASGIDYLQTDELKHHLLSAHITACTVEDGFLWAWTSHLGYNTTEMALEITNPIRKQFASHRQNIVSVQRHTTWPWPDEAQLNEAIAFYRRILR
jgi:hypothetical protein